MKPITEQVIQTLRDNDFEEVERNTFAKRIEKFAEAGTVSDGTRVVRVCVNPLMDIVSHVDGWNNMVKYVLAINYDDPKAVINDALEKEVL